MTVLEEALARLRKEYIDREGWRRSSRFKCIFPLEARTSDYEILAPKLGMSPNAVSVAVHRLRQRYRECIRLELGQTVASPQALEEEMKYLFSVLNP